MSEKRGIFISTTSQVLVRVIGLVISVAMVKLLTNYLGKEGTGEYNTITTFLNFSIVIADLGLFSSTIREITRTPEREAKILGNVFTIRVITALIATILAIAVINLTHYDPRIKLGAVVASGYIFFNLTASFYDIILQHRLKMQYSALAELFSKAIALTALAAIIAIHGSFMMVTSTIVLSGIIILVVKWFFSRRMAVYTPSYDRQLARWILTISAPLGLVYFVNNLYFKIDSLILFALKGAAAAGVYTVSYKLLEVSVFIGSYFSSALKPALSRTVTKGEAGSIINKGLLILLGSALPITVVSLVYAKEIIIFLSNKDFIDGIVPLIVLSCTLPLLYWDMLLGEVLIALDARTLLIRISLFIFAFNVILNLIFIPLFSMRGAAFTTLASELVLMLINLYYTKKLAIYTLDFPRIFSLLFCALGAAAAGWLIHGLPLNFILGSILITAFYLVLVWMLGIVSPQQVKSLIKG
jgi:O-antigen/teichoic acid export membrane protein